jgi:hypothetical protein
MKKILLSTIVLLALTVSCTENARVKHFGGTGDINLPKGRKLVNVTWKENQVWYLTRKIKPGESPETYRFQEESSWGVVEGVYIIHETN